ncbi:hypothetical protein [Burkholderia ubonensis]|uniref:hypothetical protein n=1 Tax=Burkholderia ubonensis TaxID=101571 RepID=UPI000A4EB46C|nr:hypothetical protein [Burkholderia ubonensis]
MVWPWSGPVAGRGGYGTARDDRGLAHQRVVHIVGTEGVDGAYRCGKKRKSIQDYKLLSRALPRLLGVDITHRAGWKPIVDRCAYGVSWVNEAIRVGRQSIVF